MIRGVDTSVRRIRRQVFVEVAKFAFDYKDGDFSEMEKIPYKIISGEESTLRDSVFLERAIVGERMRLAMGLPYNPANVMKSVTDGVEECAREDVYYEPPLMNVIKFACHKCLDNYVRITDVCQNCLSHSCQEVCPKKAIELDHGRMRINQEKCIKCKKCASVCSYNAIVVRERPCQKVCGMKAISSDEYGRAEIDYNKCVSCGQCMVECPYGAISDKSQIFQLIQAMKSKTPVIAVVAPAIVGQFGPNVTAGKIYTALMKLGFADVQEVALGADYCAISEAKEFVNEVPEKLPFMITSCCPAWRRMVKINFPELKDNISTTLTPMVLTGRMVKKMNPNAKTVFIGPCSSKKLEAQRTNVRSDIDFVLTFEELMAMFIAKGINIQEVEETENVDLVASADGWGFAKTGGVANAVVNVISKEHPDKEVKVLSFQGLIECKKGLQLAKAGKFNGYLLEGMGCPGGCIAGAGTIADVSKAARGVAGINKETRYQYSFDDGMLPLFDGVEDTLPEEDMY